MPPTKGKQKTRMTAEHQRRKQQQEVTQDAFERLQTAVRSISDRQEQCDRLADHLSGFYTEVDKLTKGKTLFEATDLIVEQVNDIIRDAKALIEGDPYLDRVKEFVSAGNNPVYPDVLMTTRVVQQAVDRSRAQLATRSEVLTARLREAETILCALRYFTELDGHVAEQAEVKTMMDDPADVWFSGMYGMKHFDFTRLDSRDIDEYLLASLTVEDAPD